MPERKKHIPTNLNYYEHLLFISGVVTLFKWQNEPGWPVDYVSDNVTEVTGYLPEDFYTGDLNYSKLIHPDDLARVKEEVDDTIINRKERHVHKPYRIITKNKEIKWIYDHTISVYDDEKNIVCFFGYIIDISDTKSTEEALKESEERWKFAIEGSGDGIWDWDASTNKVFFSRRWKEMLGYTEEEITDSLEEWSKRVHPEDMDQVMFDLNKHFRGETEFYLNEHRVLCKDGSYKWILDRGMVISRKSDGSPLRVIGTHSDISEQKRFENELIKAKIEAEKANSAKSEFLANMSHEIRTPLTGIIGMADLTIDTELNNIQKENLINIKNSATALLDIINDILDFSKIEAGKLEFETVEFNLRDVIENTFDLISLRAYEKNIQIICTIEENVPDFVFGDPIRLRQILLNLLSNAVKFTEKGEIEITADLLPDSEEDITNISFSIRDTGIGIEQSKIDKIFESFTQEDNSTTRKFGGTGLGLAICKKITELSGGSISVKSHKGRGSTFTFNIPYRTSSKKETSYTLPESLKEIMIIEENLPTQKNLCAVFERAGKKCITSNNGISGLKLLKNHRNIDLIIIDQDMEFMDGCHIAEKIRDTLEIKELPILLINTSNDITIQDSDYTRLNISSTISKPVKRKELYKKINMIFGELTDKTEEKKEIKKIENKKIMIAEDNQINIKILSGYIKNTGAELIIASDGKEAYEKYLKEEPDIIFMDINMPEMDGYEVTKKIREYEAGKKHTYIAAVTANAFKEDKERSFRTGMDAYISKPFEKKDILDIIYNKKKEPEIKTEKITINNTEIFNKEEFLIRINNDETIYHEVTVWYKENVMNNINILKAKISRNDYEGIYQDAHMLKGVSANLSAYKIKNVFEKIEKLAKNNGSIEDIKIISESLEDYFRELVKLF